MNYIGISFEIPNKYGNYMSEILKPLPYAEFQWLIEDDEIYKIIDDEFLDERLFENTNNVLPGNDDCQIVLGVYDCSYVMLWCKDNNLVSLMFNYIYEKRYDNLQYISEDELLEGKYRII